MSDPSQSVSRIIASGRTIKHHATTLKKYLGEREVTPELARRLDGLEKRLFALRSEVTELKERFSEMRKLDNGQLVLFKDDSGKIVDRKVLTAFAGSIYASVGSKRFRTAKEMGLDPVQLDHLCAKGLLEYKPKGAFGLRAYRRRKDAVDFENFSWDQGEEGRGQS